MPHSSTANNTLTSKDKCMLPLLYTAALFNSGSNCITALKLLTQEPSATTSHGDSTDFLSLFSTINFTVCLLFSACYTMTTDSKNKLRNSHTTRTAMLTIANGAASLTDLIMLSDERITPNNTAFNSINLVFSLACLCFTAFQFRQLIKSIKKPQHAESTASNDELLLTDPISTVGTPQYNTNNHSILDDHPYSIHIPPTPPPVFPNNLNGAVSPSAPHFYDVTEQNKTDQMDITDSEEGITPENYLAEYDAIKHSLPKKIYQCPLQRPHRKIRIPVLRVDGIVYDWENLRQYYEENPSDNGHEQMIFLTNDYAKSKCVVLQDKPHHPVCCPDGHIGDVTAYKQWLQQSATCPVDRRPLQLSQLTPVFTLFKHDKKQHKLIEKKQGHSSALHQYK